MLVVPFVRVLMGVPFPIVKVRMLVDQVGPKQQFLVRQDLVWNALEDGPSFGVAKDHHSGGYQRDDL